jgi:hypothetical protein
MKSKVVCLSIITPIPSANLINPRHCLDDMKLLPETFFELYMTLMHDMPGAVVRIILK